MHTVNQLTVYWSTSNLLTGILLSVKFTHPLALLKAMAATVYCLTFLVEFTNLLRISYLCNAIHRGVPPPPAIY